VKNGVKNIQATAYNGMRTVYDAFLAKISVANLKNQQGI